MIFSKLKRAVDFEGKMMICEQDSEEKRFGAIHRPEKSPRCSRGYESMR